MFTGIIQAVGKVREPEKLGDGVRLTIVAPKEFHLDEVKVGDSIACNGACMTVTGINGDEFNVDVSAESLSKTVGLNTFGYINLEKAVGRPRGRSLGERSRGRRGSGGIDGTGGGKLETHHSGAEEVVPVFGLQGIRHGERRVAHRQFRGRYGGRFPHHDQPHSPYGGSDDLEEPQGAGRRESRNRHHCALCGTHDGAARRF